MNSEAYVDMGTCLGCGLDWRMSKTEHNWWTRKGTGKGLSLPKRCPVCRIDRRASQKKFGEEVKGKRISLSNKIYQLAEEVKEGVYDDKRYELSMILIDLHEEARKIPAKIEEYLKEKPSHEPHG